MAWHYHNDGNNPCYCPWPALPGKPDLSDPAAILAEGYADCMDY